MCKSNHPPPRSFFSTAFHGCAIFTVQCQLAKVDRKRTIADYLHLAATLDRTDAWNLPFLTDIAEFAVLSFLLEFWRRGFLYANWSWCCRRHGPWSFWCVDWQCLWFAIPRSYQKRLVFQKSFRVAAFAAAQQLRRSKELETSNSWRCKQFSRHPVGQLAQLATGQGPSKTLVWPLQDLTGACCMTSYCATERSTLSADINSEFIQTMALTVCEWVCKIASELASFASWAWILVRNFRLTWCSSIPVQEHTTPTLLNFFGMWNRTSCSSAKPLDMLCSHGKAWSALNCNLFCRVTNILSIEKRRRQFILFTKRKHILTLRCRVWKGQWGIKFREYIRIIRVLQVFGPSISCCFEEGEVTISMRYL